MTSPQDGAPVAWVIASERGDLRELERIVRETGEAGQGVAWFFPNGERLHRRRGRGWTAEAKIDREASTIEAPIDTGRAIPIEVQVQIRFAPNRRASAKPSIAAAERACEAWLRKEIEADAPSKAKAAWRADAQSRFEGLSVRAFERAWSLVAPAKWRTAGRPKAAS